MQPGATLEEALLRRSLLFRLLALVLAGEQPSPHRNARGTPSFPDQKSAGQPVHRIRPFDRRHRPGAARHPNHLTKLFRRELGMSVRDYLHQRRLEYAEKLLTSESLSIGEIALAAGFTDPNYFIRFFRRRKGVSPGNFRKQTPSTVDRRIFSRKNHAGTGTGSGKKRKMSYT
ncbi:MAG: helix-turn-helix transcriptional regulator [Lentisphaeria bacterium]|nr:MAG: helix-turn-helix transcriptional regulator [Lentisphaeria bacterium]